MEQCGKILIRAEGRLYQLARTPRPCRPRAGSTYSPHTCRIPSWLERMGSWVLEAPEEVSDELPLPHLHECLAHRRYCPRIPDYIWRDVRKGLSSGSCIHPPRSRAKAARSSLKQHCACLAGVPQYTTTPQSALTNTIDSI